MKAADRIWPLKSLKGDKRIFQHHANTEILVVLLHSVVYNRKGDSEGTSGYTDRSFFLYIANGIIWAIKINARLEALEEW